MGRIEYSGCCACIMRQRASPLVVYVLCAPAPLAQLNVEELGEPRPCPNLSLGKSGVCHSLAFFSLSPKEFTFHAQVVSLLSVKGMGFEKLSRSGLTSLMGASHGG